MKCTRCKKNEIGMPSTSMICDECTSDKRTKGIFRDAGKATHSCSHIPECTPMQSQIWYGWCPICKAEKGCLPHGPDCTCGLCKPALADGHIQLCIKEPDCDCPGCRPDLWVMKEAPDYEGRVPHHNGCACELCGGTMSVRELPKHKADDNNCVCPKCCPVNYRWHDAKAIDTAWQNKTIGKPACRLVVKENGSVDQALKAEDDAKEHVDACDNPKCMHEPCIDKRLAEPAKQIADLRANVLPIIDNAGLQDHTFRDNLSDTLIDVVGRTTGPLMDAMIDPITDAIETEVAKRLSRHVSDAIAAEMAIRTEKIRERVAVMRHNMLLSKVDFEDGNAKLAYVSRRLDELDAELSGDPESATISDDEKRNSDK